MNGLGMTRQSEFRSRHLTEIPSFVHVVPFNKSIIMVRKTRERLTVSYLPLKSICECQSKLRVCVDHKYGEH